MKLSKRANFWLNIIGVIGVLVEYGLFNLFLYKLNKESIESKKVSDEIFKLNKERERLENTARMFSVVNDVNKD